MDNEKVYTSEQILRGEDLYHLQGIDGFKYLMTKDEIEWFKFIQNKYAIADYIYSNTDGNFILSIDYIGVSMALDDDCKDLGKAVMLSDDSALQKIFFWTYVENC